MKVLDLQCGHQHTFEGWFGSEDDFQSQLGRGLVACPMCGDTAIVKMLSAPRLNLGAVAPRGEAREAAGQGSEAAGGGSAPQTPNLPAVQGGAAPAGVPAGAAAAGLPAEMQAAWLRMARHVMANTENVGERFADEARRMHYGETEERGIRGQATRQETMALLDEGIGVMPLPLPDALKETLQ